MKNRSFRLLILLSLVFMGKSLVLAQGRIKLIDITEQGKSISLLNQADYALSERRCKTLADVQHLDWHLLNDSVTAKKEFEFSVLQYWIHFSTHSAFTRDSTLLLKFDSKMQHTQLFERIGDKLVLIGQTGFGSKTSALSIANDYWRIYLPLKSQKTQDFYVLIKKHQYNIVPQYPKIETYDTAYRELNNELILFPLSFKNIKLWFAGFYFTVFIYCCLKFFFQRKNIAYLYYALASIAWFFRYSLQADAIILETDWLPKLNNNFIFYLSFVPQNFFYILFLGKFLKANENKYLNIYLKCCLWFWGFMVVVIVVHYFRPELTPITKTIWIYNALPVLVLTLWLAYHARPKPNQGYLRFAFLGLLTISIALIFSVVPKWLNIANLPAWYYAVNSYVDLVTLAFAVDAILFLTALAYSDRLDELERINLKIKNAENEHKILRLQMNPHFIFNCLNSINLYIEQNNSELASSYLSKFSQLMRLSLSHSRKDKIVLSEEIKTIKLYLEMETMRFKGKLKYTFEIDDDVDTDFIEIPPMLVQPYIENAIWHGLMHKNDGGEIRINISQDFKQQTLLISIKDDGIGRLKAAELNSKDVEKEKSYGTLITGERIANFNKEFNTNTQIRIEDLYGENNEANGTMVLISIHLI